MGCLTIVALVAVSLVGLWIWKYPSGTWRYKMTLTVQTPEGVKTGSAVREVHIITAPELMPLSTSSAYSRGEAVVIDLGQQGVLFGLMRGDKYGEDYGHHVFLSAFGKNGSAGTVTPKGVEYFDTLKVGTKVELTRQDFPMLVRFKDINDPKSVERVDPNNLSATYGAGVKLIGATIEITDEPITTGIEKMLGWLPSHRKGYLDGQFAGGGPELSNVLHSGDFQKGTNQ